MVEEEEDEFADDCNLEDGLCGGDSRDLEESVVDVDANERLIVVVRD